MTNTTIKPLTPLMTTMLIDVAEHGKGVATGRELITLRGLEARGLVQIISQGRAFDSAHGKRMVYTTTEKGLELAIELV
jgi:hypothetical protein